MIGTTLLYLLEALIPAFIFSAYYKGRGKAIFHKNLLFLLVLTILSTIIGGRYNVGKDWPEYLEFYKNIHYYFDYQHIFEESLEPGFLMLGFVCNGLGLSSSGYFFVIAFMIYLLIYGGMKDRPFLYCWIAMFFMTQFHSISLNIIRQAIAVAIFLYSTRYINNNNKKLLLCICAAFSFHYSSIILLIALIINKEWFNFLDRKYLVCSIFVASIILAPILMNIVMDYLPLLTMSDKYMRNAATADEELMTVSSGLGLIVIKVCDIALILTSDKVVRYYDDVRIKCIYRLFFVGIILSSIFGLSVMLSRLPLGLVMLRIYILALSCHYYFKVDRRLSILGLALLAINLMMTITGVMHGDGGCSPYQFKWL